MRKIATAKTNMHIEKCLVKYDFVKPEPEQTIILIPFKIAYYDRDCDGSALAALENITLEGYSTGSTIEGYGLDESTGFVVTKEELKKLAE